MRVCGLILIATRFCPDRLSLLHAINTNANHHHHHHRHDHVQQQMARGSRFNDGGSEKQSRFFEMLEEQGLIAPGAAAKIAAGERVDTVRGAPSFLLPSTVARFCGSLVLDRRSLPM